MSLYGSFSIDNLLSELATARTVKGQLLTPTQQRNAALQNLSGGSALTAAELQTLEGAVAGVGTASKALVLDADAGGTLPGNDLEVTAHADMVAAAGFIASRVEREGSLIKTTIIVDLDGLESGSAGDVIGPATPGVSHLGQITAARNGTLLYGTITCIETPAGGDPDVDFYAADDDDLLQDTAISAATNESQLLNTGDWTGAVATPELMTALPGDGQYLYMVDAGGTAVEYSAGIFKVELYGV